MKLPIQAQPVSRKVSSARLAKTGTSAVGASECSSDCDWARLACRVAGRAGAPGIVGCLAALGAANCFGCVTEMLENLNLPGNMGVPAGQRLDRGAP